MRVHYGAQSYRTDQNQISYLESHWEACGATTVEKLVLSYESRALLTLQLCMDLRTLRFHLATMRTNCVDGYPRLLCGALCSGRGRHRRRRAPDVEETQQEAACGMNSQEEQMLDAYDTKQELPVE